MKRSGLPPVWLWIALGSSVLMLLNLSFAARREHDLTATSWGKGLDGFGALHDVLVALSPAVARSTRPFAELPIDRTLWLLQPGFLHAAAGGKQQAWSGELDREQQAELERWLERGGSALIFGAAESDWQRFGLAQAKSDAAARASLQLGAAPVRALGVASLQRFERADGYAVRARVNGAALVVEKRVGAGRLVAIADAQLFDNEHLGMADHALVALDLARAYGPPLFDERSHGLLDDASLLGALGLARSLLLGSCLGLWATLAILRLRRVPAAQRAPASGPPPGLASFVDPLALLYSRKAVRYPEAAHRAYLHGLRFRLRRVLYGPRGGSDAQLDRRLARDLAGDTALRDALQGVSAPRSVRELEPSVRRLEQYLASVARAQRNPGE